MSKQPKRLLWLIEQVQKNGLLIDECIEWPFGRNKDGYGNLGVNYKVYRVHRIAYQIIFGNLTPESKVLHKCDNPPCFNPNHLSIGTQLDNIKDRDSKGRTKYSTHCPSGHSLEGINLYIRPSDKARVCRTCTNKASQQYKKRKKESV